jgi:DNA-binding transcriptional LysR family regulator
MTLSQLRTFIAVAEDGSVRAAAERLRISQPSVSGSVAALSDEVGAPLTEREGRGLRLSAAGQAFLPHAREALGLLEQGARLARTTAAVERATIRIAAVYTAAEYLLPPLLRAFREQHPEMPIHLEIGNRERVLDLLGTRQADLAVGGRAPDDGRFDGTRICANEHIVVAAPDHPLAGEQRVPLYALADETWLVREASSGTRRLVDEYLLGADLAPRVTTIGSNNAVAASAMVGLGVGVVPRVAVDHLLEAGMLARLDVDPAPPARDWFAILPRRRPDPRAATMAEFLAAAEAARPTALAGA